MREDSLHDILVQHPEMMGYIFVTLLVAAGIGDVAAFGQGYPGP